MFLAIDDAPCSLRNKSLPFLGQHSAPGEVDAPQMLHVTQLLI